MHNFLKLTFDLGWLNRFWPFLCVGLSSFNPKGFCYPYKWSCGVCEGRTSFCNGIISRKPYRLLFMFPTSFTSSSVLLVFPVSITVSSWGLDHKDYLTYSWATDRYSEFCYNFSIQITLPQWLTFLHGSLTVTLTVLIVWISFFLLMLVFVLQCFSFKWAVS